MTRTDALALLLVLAPFWCALATWHYSGYRKGGRYDHEGNQR